MKKIVINGKVVWVKEAGDDVQDGDPDPDPKPTAGDPPVVVPPAGDAPAGGTDEQDIDAAAEKIAKAITQKVAAQLGVGDELRRKSQRYIDQPGNEKLRDILHGKDLFEDKAKLTKEEVIVAFFHALVTNDQHTVKSLSEGVAADGGNLLPQDFANELIRDLNQNSFVRNMVRVVPMKRNTMTIPNLASGPKAYWTLEGAAKTTSTAAFTQLTLTAFKLAAILYASDELVEDSTEFDIVQLIIQLFSEHIQRAEEAAVMQGNGTTQPQGIFTSGNGIATITCTVAGLSFNDLINLETALPTKYRRNCRYVLHRDLLGELKKIRDNNGQYIWAQGNVAAGTPPSLNGYPYELSDDAHTSQICFGDWKTAYWLGDRKAITVLVTQQSETAFTQDKTAIRVVERVGGLVVQPLAARKLISIP